MSTADVAAGVAQRAVAALVTIAVVLVVAMALSALGGLLVGLTAPFVGPAAALIGWVIVGLAIGTWLIFR